MSQLDLFNPPTDRPPPEPKAEDWGSGWWLREMLPLGVSAVWVEVAAMSEEQRHWYGKAQLSTRAEDVNSLPVTNPDGTPKLEADGRQRRDPNRYCGFSEAVMWRNPGKTGPEFARLCRALAVLAHEPGGVKAFGWHWDAERDVWPTETSR